MTDQLSIKDIIRSYGHCCMMKFNGDSARTEFGFLDSASFASDGSITLYLKDSSVPPWEFPKYKTIKFTSITELRKAGWEVD